MTLARTTAALTALTITLTACTPTTPNPPATTTTSPTLIHMSTRHPDPWDITILDGWAVTKRNAERLDVTILPISGEGTAKAPGFSIDRRSGDSAYERMHKGTKPGYPIEPQDLFHHEVNRVLIREDVDITILPERLIGGEKALGYSHIDVPRASYWFQEIWFVVRHDGVWRFTLQPARWEETISPEIHQMIDSFHWETPEPTPSES